MLILLFRFLQSRRPIILCPVQFKLIHGNFFEANYHDRNVVIEFGTRYVNATKLCVDAGKKLHYWRETKMSKALVLALQNEDEHIYPYKHVETDGVSGIYCHHLIAPHLTQWISVDCAVQVGIILNNLLVHEWQDQVHIMTLTQRHYESAI